MEEVWVSIGCWKRERRKLESRDGELLFYTSSRPIRLSRNQPLTTSTYLLVLTGTHLFSFSSTKLIKLDHSSHHVLEHHPI